MPASARGEGHVGDSLKPLSELLSNRLPMAATTTKEARNELENWWARLGSNQRPAGYESPIAVYTADQKSRQTGGGDGELNAAWVNRIVITSCDGSLRQTVPRPPSQP